MPAKQAGKSGAYLVVLNKLSLYGLSLLCCGREKLAWMTRSTSSSARVLERIGAPRSASRGSGSWGTARSEERGEGKECVSTGRYRRWAEQEKKKKKKKDKQKKKRKRKKRNRRK